MKQNDVFTKRETLRPVNTLTCIDSAQTSSLYMLKMKELTAIYKQESEVLQEGLNHINGMIGERVNDLQSDIEPLIGNLRNMLAEQVKEYDNEMQSSIQSLEQIRNDNLELEKEITFMNKRLTRLDDHIGQQVLQRKYDIKFQ